MKRKTVLAATLAAFTASGMMAFPQARQVISPPGSTIPGLPFSPAVKSGDLLFVAGTMATDAEGKIAPGNIQVQTKKTLDNIGVILKAAGMDFQDVVASTVYLSDARNFDAMNQVYRETFKTTPPVRATVESELVLQGGLIEIQVIAANRGLQRQVINPSGWSTNPLPYSRALKVGDYLFVAGLVSQNPATGAAVSGDVKAQTKQILDNAKVLVETAGFQMSDMTVGRVWLSDPRAFQDMNGVYRTYFSDIPPTRATMQARLMNTAYDVEIGLWGLKGTKQRLGAAGQTPLSQAIKIGNRVIVSGIVQGTAQLRGDVKAQTKAVMDQIRTLLQQGGMDFSDAVEANVWITDIRNFAAMNEVYREYFPQSPPARATVGMRLMSADGLVEIAVSAAK